MKTLSVVIITYNEEDNIERCIKSLHDLADEVIVVDSYSSDRTVAIAEACGARVIQHAFEGHIQQKNWAKDQAQFDWILSLDADEALDDFLYTEIKKWKHIALYHTTGLYLNRLNYYCGKPYKTFGWYPDRKIRLWKKGTGEWKGTNPHDEFVMNKREPTKAFKGDILHYTYPTRTSFLQQRENFANIAAQHIKEQTVVIILFKLFFSPISRFIKAYFIQWGFTKGFIGIFISFQLSREVWLKYFRALKLKYQ